MSKLNSATLKIRGGVDRDSTGRKAGKGALIQWELSATLGVSQDQTLFVWKETDTDRHTEEKDGKYLWMLVSDDDYELPLIVCDSIDELSKACGKEINTIRSAINHAEKRGSKSRYKRVKL